MTGIDLYCGIGEKALLPVFETMDNPLETKTITLSCEKMNTNNANLFI